MPTRTQRRRKLFTVTKRDVDHPCYDVSCNVEGCEFLSPGWNYRSNALWEGWQHISSEHPNFSYARL